MNATNEITTFLHCPLCLAEMKEIAKTSPVRTKTFTRYGIGVTPTGLQIICHRHGDRTIAHFEGRILSVDSATE
jgi:hypothetical protein